MNNSNEDKNIKKSPFKEMIQPIIDLIKAPKALWGVNLTYFIEGWVYFGIIALLAIYFNEFIGVDDMVADWMVAFLTGGITFSMLLFGGLSDKWGVRIALITSLILMLIGRLLLTIGPVITEPKAGVWSPIFFISLLGLLGVILGYGMYQPAAYASVRKFTSQKTAAIGYSMLYAVMNLGGFLPGLMSPPVREQYGITGVFWVYIGLTIIGLLSTMLILTKKTVDKAIERAKLESEEESKNSEAEKVNQFEEKINNIKETLVKNLDKIKPVDLMMITSLLVVFVSLFFVWDIKDISGLKLINLSLTSELHYNALLLLIPSGILVISLLINFKIIVRKYNSIFGFIFCFSSSAFLIINKISTLNEIITSIVIVFILYRLFLIIKNSITKNNNFQRFNIISTTLALILFVILAYAYLFDPFADFVVKGSIFDFSFAYLGKQLFLLALSMIFLTSFSSFYLGYNKWCRQHPLTDVKFAMFIFILIPVQTLFAHNWLTLPQYVDRAFRDIPVEIDVDEFNKEFINKIDAIDISKIEPATLKDYKSKIPVSIDKSEIKKLITTYFTFDESKKVYKIKQNLSEKDKEAIFAIMKLIGFSSWVSRNMEFFTTLNSILIFVLTPLVGAITSKANVYKMMILGTSVMALPTFFLAIGTNVILLTAFIIFMSLGEAMWQPRFLQYAAEIAPKDRVGAYMGVAQFPWFLTKIITGLYAGWFLMNYCPEYGTKDTSTMWLIYGFIAILSPLLLIALKGYLSKSISER